MSMHELPTSHVDEKTLLRAPASVIERTSGGLVVLDPAAPHWIATDERGAAILRRLDGRTPLENVVRGYAGEAGVDPTRAWLHVETFARDALRHGFVSTDGAVPVPYLGRAAYLRTDRLRELWIQLNDFCNLACEHCLVSSGPQGGHGLDLPVLLDAVDQAVALGAERVFLTGGEPLARPDVLELIEHVVRTRERELVLMTNGTLLKGERLRTLGLLPDSRLRVQISLDGASPDVNDAIRGAGSFHRIVDGIRAAVSVGLPTTITMVLLRHNLHDTAALVRLAADLGVTNVHLLWPHRRGRVLTGRFANLPDASEILQAVRTGRHAARACGVTIDNVEELRLRLDGLHGVKNDLAGAGWTSLCLYTDGAVYPSASMAGVQELRCGSVLEQPLEEIWKQSPVLAELRGTTVEQKTTCRTCHLKFLCGGGDFEHGYWASVAATGRGSFAGHDPYCDLYKGLAAEALAELAAEGRSTVQPRSGFDRPVVYRAMGERTLHDEPAVVRTTHSACVLSEEVADRSRTTVREFYGHAAEQPQAELCCPVQPDAEDLAHIPPEVVERFYGCGSPVSAAAPQAGETLVDLGSGAGIDCFIAARRVGAGGRVVGVDMTDQMLAVARDCQPRVAASLGYDVVELRRGYLERIPLGDASADVVTSNCVINLSPDKPAVFREIWRVLKDHGRMVVADIVADREVPPALRADGQLWGECISGALSEEGFLASVERAGFYGVTLLKKIFWREVAGTRFYSVTVRGYKFEKKAGCRYVGQRATYLGPMKAAIDEEGHLFPRGVPVEVCSDTAAKLQAAPCAGAFAVSEGTSGSVAYVAGDRCCTPGGNCC
ncbi:MAG: methyltransferase domain-containing protein [Acidobacteria bacterium]|nr:methyltransferase domain-containing protein [Acidobacteriota bacterium]